MPATFLHGQNSVIEISDAVQTASESFAQSRITIPPVAARRLNTSSSGRETRHLSDKRIVTVTKGNEEFCAVLVDLEFELFARGEPTPAIIAKIVKRYLLIALEAMAQQTDQGVLIMIFGAKPATIAKVRSHGSDNLQASISDVLSESKGDLPPLYVLLHAEARTSRGWTQPSRFGRVQEEEVRRLLENLQKPGSE